jgi:hypothetical protein
VKQYYYKTNDCKALHATDAECICWHDEGTGPFPGHRIGVHTCHWRDKPEANKMVSDTPRTDEQINGKPCTRFAILAGDSLRDALVPSDFARQLERELNAANSKIELLMSANADVARIADQRDAAEKRIRLLIAERDTAQLRASQNWKIREEFRALLGTDDVATALAVVRELQDRIKRLEDAMSEIAYAASHPLGAGQSLTLGKIESIAIKAKEAKP